MIPLNFVTRNDNTMNKTSKKRGRPRTANPVSAAERMRTYRKRKRQATSRTEECPSLGARRWRRWSTLFRSPNSRFPQSRDALSNCPEDFTKSCIDHQGQRESVGLEREDRRTEATLLQAMGGYSCFTVAGDLRANHQNERRCNASPIFITVCRNSG